MKRINVTPILFLSLLASGCRPAGSANVSDPSVEHVAAKVAIIVDGTISFAERLPEVEKVVTSFVAQNAVIGEAEVFLYRLDRSPKLVARINASQFMTSSQSALVRSLGQGTGQSGTDLVAALEMASEKLNSESSTRADHKFLLVFTDGHIDPAKDADRVTPFRGADEFDWTQLGGIKTRFFFLDHGPYKSLAAASSNSNINVAFFEDGEPVLAKDLRNLIEGGH